MFLPVIFLRDFGLWGWIVFAIPNVIGAAAMGWVLAKPGLGERLVREHAGACAAFSIVTIAFHVFFVLWFIPRLVGLPFAAAAFALVAIYLLATATRPKSDLPSGILVWFFSIAMLVWFLRGVHHPTLPITGTHPAVSSLWIAPVCVFGFLFCPYLDLTFHRARQAVDETGSRLAFGLGFGVCFLLMIVFTLLYATTLMPLLSEQWREHLRPALGAVIAAHMIVQAAFTISVHTRSFVTAQVSRGSVLGLLVFAQVAVFLGLASYLLPRYHGRDPGEIIYMLFMGCYALIFPGYVWLCMIPGRDGQTGPTPAKLRALLLAVVVALPMLWMGFIEGHLAWLAPGIAVMLVSRYTIVVRPARADVILNEVKDLAR